MMLKYILHLAGFSFLIFEDNIIEKDMPSEIRSRFRVTKLLGSGGSASVFLVYEGVNIPKTLE